MVWCTYLQNQELGFCCIRYVDERSNDVLEASTDDEWANQPDDLLRYYL